jgi:hypothetical protein
MLILIARMFEDFNCDVPCKKLMAWEGAISNFSKQYESVC